MEGAVLQDMLWGVGACLTRAVRGVRQPQSTQVRAQTAVSSAQPKDHNLLVALEMVDCVTWIVVSQLFGAASDFTLDERLSLSVGNFVVLLLERAAVLCQSVCLLVSIKATVSRDPLDSNICHL